MSNHAVVLKEYFEGPATPECFEVVAVEAPPVEVQPGHIVVRAQWLSVDPYMTSRMRPPKGPSYVPPFEEGKALSGDLVAVIEQSKAEAFAVGRSVRFFGAYQTLQVTEADPKRVTLIPEDEKAEDMGV